MATVLLPILPGTLPPGICFSSEQERLNEYAANMSAQLPGLAYYNYGNTKPLPADNAYPWLNTLDMAWYEFVGVWRRPHPVTPSGNDRQLWVGTLAALITKDGGTAGAVTATSGPMWEEDVAFNDRLAMGVGATLAPNVGADTGIATASVTFTSSNLPLHQHYMFSDEDVAQSFNYPTGSTGVARARSGGSDFVNERYVLLRNTVGVESTVGLTSAVGSATPTPTSVLNPVRGVYFIKRTARIYITVP